MFVIKRRTLLISAVLLVTAAAFVVSLFALYYSPAKSADITPVKIVLDAGHGGIDGGVTGIRTGVKESELNLKVVKKLEKYIIDAGMTAVLTRETEAGLYGVAGGNLKRKDMEKRRDIIRSAAPDLVVSVHMNKYSMTSRRGAQVFFKENDAFSKSLADSIQKSFNAMEEASRSCVALKGDYYLLNCTSYPSVIAECGFLSNPDDESLLITDEYQEKIAYALFKGIVGYLAESSFKFCD